MLNRVSLIGHVGADPEAKKLTSGDPVVNLRLATTESWKDKTTNERREQTEWHSIVIYNENLCRIVEQYVKKGSRIFIEGALRTRKFTGNDGKDQYRTEIVLGRFNGTVTLLDRAGGGERPAHGPEAYGTQSTREERRPAPASASTGGGRGGYDLDDDIPF